MFAGISEEACAFRLLMKHGRSEAVRHFTSMSALSSWPDDSVLMAMQVLLGQGALTVDEPTDPDYTLGWARKRFAATTHAGQDVTSSRRLIELILNQPASDSSAPDTADISSFSSPSTSTSTHASHWGSSPAADVRAVMQHVLRYARDQQRRALSHHPHCATAALAAAAGMGPQMRDVVHWMLAISASVDGLDLRRLRRRRARRKRLKFVPIDLEGADGTPPPSDSQLTALGADVQPEPMRQVSDACQTDGSMHGARSEITADSSGVLAVLEPVVQGTHKAWPGRPSISHLLDPAGLDDHPGDPDATSDPNASNTSSGARTPIPSTASCNMFARSRAERLSLGGAQPATEQTLDSDSLSSQPQASHSAVDSEHVPQMLPHQQGSGSRGNAPANGCTPPEAGVSSENGTCDANGHLEYQRGAGVQPHCEAYSNGNGSQHQMGRQAPGGQHTRVRGSLHGNESHPMATGYHSCSVQQQNGRLEHGPQAGDGPACTTRQQAECGDGVCGHAGKSSTEPLAAACDGVSAGDSNDTGLSLNGLKQRTGHGNAAEMQDVADGMQSHVCASSPLGFDTTAELGCGDDAAAGPGGSEASALRSQPEAEPVQMGELQAGLDAALTAGSGDNGSATSGPVEVAEEHSDSLQPPAFINPFIAMQQQFVNHAASSVPSPSPTSGSAPGSGHHHGHHHHQEPLDGCTQLDFSQLQVPGADGMGVTDLSWMDFLDPDFGRPEDDDEEVWADEEEEGGAGEEGQGDEERWVLCPLAEAAAAGDRYVVELLLEVHGADPTAHGGLAERVARANGHTVIAKLIYEKALAQAVARGQAVAVQDRGGEGLSATGDTPAADSGHQYVTFGDWVSSMMPRWPRGGSKQHRNPLRYARWGLAAATAATLGYLVYTSVKAPPAAGTTAGDRGSSGGSAANTTAAAEAASTQAALTVPTSVPS